jgi:hypothetical protein
MANKPPHKKAPHKKPPQPRDVLTIQTHLGYIWKSPDGVLKTLILFSIMDPDWMAWYVWAERSKEIDRAISDQEIDALNGKENKSSWSHFGIKGHPTDFQPSKPLRVDEVARGAAGFTPTTARAHLMKRPINAMGKIWMGLTVFLDSGPQDLHLLMDSNKALQQMQDMLDLPTSYKQGEVFRAYKVEEYPAGLVSHTHQTQQGWLLPVTDLRMR